MGKCIAHKLTITKICPVDLMRKILPQTVLRSFKNFVLNVSIKNGFFPEQSEKRPDLIKTYNIQAHKIYVVFSLQIY